MRRLQLSLVAAQLVGAATLLRSVAYDRWITALAAALLIVGATAARRGRSWGVWLALGAAASFPVAWAIGIAPPWFCLVGVVGALPFAIASRAFARFDKGATTLLAFLAASTGAISAIAWKQYAWSFFTTFPISQPSREAQHGVALAALATLVVVAGVLARGKHGITSGQRVRVAEQLRVGDSTHREEEATLDLDLLDAEDDANSAAPQRRSRLP